jgi:hypothetical protein
MGRTRRSGRTAGEALLLQLHIAGSQKGVGPFSNRRASVACAWPQPQTVPPGAMPLAILCDAAARMGLPASGHEQVTVLRSEGPQCRS